MATEIFSNFASALLAAPVIPADTTIQVENGYGSLFPSPGAQEFFTVVVEDSLGNKEVMSCTSRATDLLTVARAQEGTAAQNFSTGSRVEVRLTKGMLDRFLQLSGGTMTGDLNMATNDILTATLQTPTIIGGTTQGTILQASDAGAGNQIVIPAGGGDVTIGGSAVYTAGNLNVTAIVPAGVIVMWSGAIGSIPAGWALCDGTNGTPNLVNRFVVCAGDTYSVGATGGATTQNPTTSAAGGHTPVAAGTALDVTHLPQHNHQIYVWQAGGDSSGNAESFTGGAAKGVAGDNNTDHTYGYRDTTLQANKIIQNTGSASPATHTHVMDAVPDHQHTVSVTTMPPYYALAYIMKL